MKKITLFLINLWFLLMSLLVYRCAFFFMYGDHAASRTGELVHAFLVGFRFDLATAAYVLAPFAILLFLPYLSGSRKFVRTVLIMNLCWLVVLDVYLVVDLLYYPFSLRHLSFELFSIRGDLVSMIKLGIMEYAAEFFLFALFVLVMVSSHLFLIRRVPSSALQS